MGGKIPAMNLRHGLLVALVLGLVLARAALGEGTQTGVIAGTVFDQTSVPLPDVEVALAGPQTRRQVTTDAEGRFRFPALEVGTYGVTAELLGLVAADREVPVYIDKTTEIALWLGEPRSDAEGLPATEETIQVLALAPLIDRFETRVGTSVSRDFLEELPVERIYQSVAQLLPGVAGAEDGNPNVGGALRSANLYLVDGVDTTDSTTGLFGLNLAYDAVREVDVTTAAVPVEYGRASGAVINVVTRSGRRDFEGSVRVIAASDDWRSDYGDPAEHLGPEIEAANSSQDEVDTTLAATLAGPLAPERLWFFTAFESTDSSLLRPTLEGTLWDEDTTLESAALKLTWQVSAGHSLVGQYTADDATFAAFAPFDRSPGENRASETPQRLEDSEFSPLPGDVFALEDRSQDGELVKLQWNAALSQNLSLALGLASQDRRLERGLLNDRGVTSGAPHYSIVPLFLPDREEPILQELGFFNGITDEGFEERRREQGNLTADWFFSAGRADHGLRLGVDYQRTRSERLFNVGGLDTLDALTGRPAAGQIFIDLDIRPECIFLRLCASFDPRDGSFQPFVLFNFWQRPARETELETLAFHAADSLSLGRWLLSFGARFESVRGDDEAGRRLVEDDAVDPRLGVKYDPKGDGKVLLSATYSRYQEPFLQAYLDDFLRAEPFSGFTEYEWGAFRGLDCGGENPADLFSPCWIPTGGVPFFRVQSAEPNPELERAAVEELSLGFESQLTAHTALRLTWVDRRWEDLWDDSLRVVVADGELFAVAAVRNIPEAERRYRGLQLLVQKRFSRRWQLLGSYTWSETEGNLFRSNGRSTFDDFSDVSEVNVVNRFGPAPYDSSHQLKLFANVRVPLGWGDLSLGTAARYQDGTPYQPERLEELGLRFLARRGSLRLDDVFQWDLSAALDLPLAATAVELEVKLEAFNVTDEQTRIGVETEVGTGRFALPRSIADLQRPRWLRLTLGLRF